MTKLSISKKQAPNDRTPLPSLSIASPSFPWRRILIGLIVMIVVGILATGVGSVNIPPDTSLKVFASKLPGMSIEPDWPDTTNTILLNLRLPRIILAGVVGATLAISGAIYQGLFRNPLADPYLIGVASGAGLAATVVMLTGIPTQFHGVSILPMAAFLGAIIAVAMAYSIAGNSGGLPLTNLILSGVAVAAFASALTTLLMVRSNPDLRPVLSWLMGNFISARWSHTAMMLPYIIPSALIALAYGRILNILQLGEDYAKQLGVNVETTKLILIISATVTTAAAVSFSGLIGFVGLIAPHAVRLRWGVDYRFLLPMSSIVGAIFLIAADLGARVVVSPAELPVGIVTAFCGAPFFLYLLRRSRETPM